MLYTAIHRASMGLMISPDLSREIIHRLPMESLDPDDSVLYQDAFQRALEPLVGVLPDLSYIRAFPIAGRNPYTSRWFQVNSNDPTGIVRLSQSKWTIFPLVRDGSTSWIIQSEKNPNDRHLVSTPDVDFHKNPAFIESIVMDWISKEFAFNPGDQMVLLPFAVYHPDKGTITTDFQYFEAFGTLRSPVRINVEPGLGRIW